MTWRVIATLLISFVLYELPAAMSQATQETINERHRSAIERLERDIHSLNASDIEARLRLLEDSKEETRMYVRVISTVMLGHIVAAIWQNRRQAK